MKKKIALIFGVTGQDGSYLSEFLLKKNYIVHGVKRRSSSLNTQRIDHIYQDPHQHKKSSDNLLQKAENCSCDTLIQYYEAMIKRPDRTELLVTAKFPVLFVMGFEDKAVPFSHSLQQSHLPPIGHISILRGSAHMGMIEEPAKSLLVLTDFLRAIYV